MREIEIENQYEIICQAGMTGLRAMEPLIFQLLPKLSITKLTAQYHKISP